MGDLGPNLENEAKYSKYLKPLSICKQPSQGAGDMADCFHYSCSGCAQPAVTGDLIQLVLDGDGKALPKLEKDIGYRLDPVQGHITPQQPITDDCRMGRYCKACYCKVTGKKENDITASKFHRHVGDSQKGLGAKGDWVQGGLGSKINIVVTFLWFFRRNLRKYNEHHG